MLLHPAVESRGKDIALWRRVPLLSGSQVSFFPQQEPGMTEFSNPQDEVTVETLIEDVSIDGMCGVY
jgi:mycofactocin precursor